MMNDYPLIAKLQKRIVNEEETRERYESKLTQFRYIEISGKDERYNVGGVFNRTSSKKTIKSENRVLENASVDDRVILSNGQILRIVGLESNPDLNQLGIRRNPRTIYILELQ